MIDPQLACELLAIIAGLSDHNTGAILVSTVPWQLDI